jgi:hypothetical protein
MSSQSYEKAEILFNDPNRVPIGEFAKRMSQIIRDVHQSQALKLITKNGKVVAGLCPLIDLAMIERGKKGEHDGI